MFLFACRLDLVYVRGKRGNKVPILLTAEVKQAIETLNGIRNLVGVHPDNKYVFAAPTRDSKRHLRGNDCLNAVLKRCAGLRCPEAMRSTKLRKYTATVSQIVDLKDNELEWLSRHLGHDINVHREYYRLQEHTLELAKISKLLLAIDEGNANKWAGKKLDDIALDGKLNHNWIFIKQIVKQRLKIHLHIKLQSLPQYR